MKQYEWTDLSWLHFELCLQTRGQQSLGSQEAAQCLEVLVVPVTGAVEQAGVKEKRNRGKRQKERDWKKWRRWERKEKEKEELITMVCWALLATVLSALQTFFQSLQQLYEVSVGNTSVLLIRVLRRTWGHLPKVIQLVSSRSVIWTPDYLTPKSSTSNHDAMKEIYSPTAVWKRATTDNHPGCSLAGPWRFFFCFLFL